MDFPNQESRLPNQTFYELSAVDIEGQAYPFSKLRDKVVLIVNTASRCGFTSQYKGLEDLYLKYKEQGLVVLGFPSNDFMGQEPGDNEDIKQFCQLNYNVSFPLFSKAAVKGSNKQPVYRHLTEKSGPDFQGDVGWNFVKFLVSRSGSVIARFSSLTKPTNKTLIKKIEAALK